MQLTFQSPSIRIELTDANGQTIYGYSAEKIDITFDASLLVKESGNLASLFEEAKKRIIEAQ